MKDLKSIAIQRNPIEAYIRATGRTINTKGKEPTVCCFLHDDKNPSMRFNPEKGSWYCDPCGVGGNVIDLHMAITGQTFADAVKELAGEDGRDAGSADDSKLERTIEYDYNDAYGQLVFRVVRIEKGGKKTFRQYHFENGKPVYNMNGVTRVLYRMDKIADKQQVFLVEGEKCVAAMVRLGFDATTNCGGSSNWMPAYADALKDKDVVIMPDNDEPGKKWHKAVLSSLIGKCKSIQTLHLPDKYNDIGDAYAEKGDDACDLIFAMMEKEPVVERGADVPIFSSAELMQCYKEEVTAEHRISLDLGRWLPILGRRTRPLVPGDLFLVMAATGVGKSAVLQNIALAVPEITTLMFQLELPKTLMAERWTAIKENTPSHQVERKVQQGHTYDTDSWSHIYTCDMSGIDTDKIEEIIQQSELKIGHRPHVVMVDYIGLVSGGGSRYEKLSDNIEQLKVIAKRCNVIMGVSSQLKRKEQGIVEVFLSDAKESGSLENSAGLVLGCWRPEAEKMIVKVLKDTKGGAAGNGGTMIECAHGGATLKITEIGEAEWTE